ncbi:PREDICTED: interferon alpha/beta receptor 1 [Eurypyga helias]|uniref:interferon alpha/beta receptor 1 n=1 Tax=Eurypyga helias TaxID=54383 RepID=UPI0005295591|nr:PREDICTED: interferon alpha/beta receptor 1 [Eurypyga helias]
MGHLGFCISQSQTTLKTPWDIQVYVVNTNFTLRWNYTGNDSNVAFSAEYRWSEDFETVETEWNELPGCQNVTGTECDFSSAVTEYYDMHHVRVRAERRKEVSPWSDIFEMIPYFIAQIGPPGIELQSTNGIIKIKVSPPEANAVRKMWIAHLRFKYNLVLWENSSNAEFRSLSIFPTHVIDDLAPDTTYCMKVQATLPLDFKEGLFSPVRCIKTTRKVNDLLCATNVSILASNMKFHLHWNNPYKQHVSYNVQYLIGYLKKLHDDYSPKWLNVHGCENITVTQCNFSSIITTTGFYYLRVQAMSESNRSCLSNEVKVNPLITNEIGPPGIKVDISDVLLHIQISPPGGSESEVMRDHYDLSYRILYWKNSSNNEEDIKMKEVKQTIATISDLTPSTLYCVKVQAFSQIYNKSSDYSKEECIQTPGDKILPLIILATFVTALIVVLLVATLLVFALYQAYNKIKYVFFPSCHPPLNIEGFAGQPFIRPYLSTTEEPTEICSIIETVLTEVNHIDFKDYKHSKQSSRDSGNYSNDDDTSGSKASEEKEIV